MGMVRDEASCEETIVEDFVPGDCCLWLLLMLLLVILLLILRLVSWVIHCFVVCLLLRTIAWLLACFVRLGCVYVVFVCFVRLCLS